MPIPASSKASADFAPVPSGTHHAICYGVVDLGTQPSNNPQFPDYRKVCILWELPNERADFPDKADKTKTVNKARAISQIYTLSLDTKATLRKVLESWRARAFTPEELDGFDISRLIEANCLLSVVHKNGTGKNLGKVFANIAGVSALPKGMEKIKPENPRLYFSLFDLKPTEEVIFPENMSEWLRQKISLSKEVSERNIHEQNPPPPVAAAEGPDEDVPF